MRRWPAAFGLWLALVATTLPAFAEKRVALVIGENEYKNLPGREQLRNAVNDARAVKAALEALHFTVDIGENLGQGALIDKLSDFGARLERDDIAFFFYAGHGVSFNGANYLLPTDIPAPRASGRDEQDRIADHSIAETRVLERIRKSGARLAVVVLDACRDNPLKDAADRSIGDSSRGLSPPPSVHDVLEIYSAGAGQTALDGGEGETNSVFTKAFVEKLRAPLGLRDLAFRTQAEVYRLAASRGHEQRPGVYSEIISDDDIFLAGRPAAPASDSAAAMRQDAFNAAMAADTDAALRDFVAKYPSGLLADIARQRLGRLAALAPAPASVMTPSPAAPCGRGVALASLSSRSIGVLSRDEVCALKRGDIFEECLNCPVMAVIPKGSFTMGSPSTEPGRSDDEGPQHVVKFATQFAVGKFDVTRDEFAEFVRDAHYDAGPSWRDPGFPQTGSHPVVDVNWDDATAYVNWLSRKTGQPYRLLSESEWEYVARGETAPGTYPRYFFGDSEKDFCLYGNNGELDAAKSVAPCASGFDRTSPVGSFKPNAFGLYDMLGDVRQWVEDCRRSNYNVAPHDGSAETTGKCSQRALRGGSWYVNPRKLRVANRGGEIPTIRSREIGLRVARTLSP